MGCGPSKDANVATGNTMNTKSLQKKNPIDSSKSTTTTTTTDPKVNSTEENGKGSKEVKVNDSTEKNGEGSEKAKVNDLTKDNGKESEEVKVNDTTQDAPEVEEGKFIAVGSPDPYFSSRKDEEAVVTSAGYASPVSEIADEENAEMVGPASDTVNACGEDLAAVAEVLGGNAEVAVMPEQEEGKAISKDAADMIKDTILVEEKETKSNVDNQKNVEEGGESSTVAH